MAVVVETGAGLPNADVFTSEANALAYLTSLGLSWAENPAATVSLTLAIQPSNGDTITLDSKTYTFQSSLTNSDGNIAIGSSLATTQQRLVSAVNLTGVGGTDYAAAMTLHPSVTAGSFSSNVAQFIAKATGSVGNSIVSTETFASASNLFSAATLSGGIDRREHELRRAAIWLGTLTYRGTKKLESQALPFPRAWLRDLEGYLRSEVTVPIEIERANALVAHKISLGYDPLADVTDPSVVEASMVQVGPIKVSKQFTGGQSLTGSYVFRDVRALLRVLTIDADRVVLP
jgi:hypothetical protein